MTATFESEISVTIDGQTFDLGPVELPVGRHLQVQLGVADGGPCECSTPEPVATEKDIDWKLTLDSLLPGTVVSDKDHDDWTKYGEDDWRTAWDGPRMRSKTLAALWSPFNIVRTPEV